MLTGSNFKVWKRDVLLAMELADIDLAMTTPKPAEINSSSTDTDKQLHTAWHKSNRLCYLTLKRSIPEHLLSGLQETSIAKDFLTAVSARYKVSINAEIGTLLKQLYSMKYKGNGGVREYILMMVHIQNKLKNLNIVLPDACIVHQALNTLPTEFGTIVTTYNSREEPWNVNDFIAICVAEEEKLKEGHTDTALIVSKPRKKGKKSKFSAFGNVQNYNKTGQTSAVGGTKGVFKKEFKCFFCKKKGHKKSECSKYKVWLEKHGHSGNSLVFVVCESNYVNATSSSWWLDSGATNYVAFTLQGFINKRKPNKDEFKLVVGNNELVEVHYVGDVCLKLDSNYELVLTSVLYVPSFRRNLISLSVLDKQGYGFEFNTGSVSAYFNSNKVGHCVLSYGLYSLCLASSEVYSNSYNVEQIAKRPLIKEKSSMLWHKRLGHISRERVERLIKFDILPNLDFSDLETCVDCCKGKLTKIKKKESTRSSDLLQIIHTDISGPYSPTICNNKYYITFIDDFSRYG